MLSRSQWWTPKEFQEHTKSCPMCRSAKSSDEYCDEAQHQLGRRSWLVDRRGGGLEAAEREQIQRRGRRVAPKRTLSSIEKTEGTPGK